MSALALTLLLAAAPAVSLSSGVEDGQRVLIATVTDGSKPVEGSRVAFEVPRAFGLLVLGEEETLDDGTAAVPFPVSLPGDASGRLEVIARVVAPEAYADLSTRTTFDGQRVREERNPFPRELWSPRAPFGLVAAIFACVGGVWVVYASVAYELEKIRKGATP